MTKVIQLKALIRNIAREKGISPQLVLQEYVIEHFLERVSVSRFKENYIVKGGFLVSCLVGLDTRATRDIDATIKSYPVSAETIQEMIKEIISLDVDDGIQILFIGIKNIREDDDYSGYRVSLEAKIESIAIPFKLDITTGDKITPREIEYSFESLIEGHTIKIKTYNLPTLLAEKLETIISRGVLNTRMRDYYDVYVLFNLKGDSLDWKEMKDALEATCQKRKTLALVKSYRDVMALVSSNGEMIRRWSSYRLTFEHASGLKLSEVCHSIYEILERIFS